MFHSVLAIADQDRHPFLGDGKHVAPVFVRTAIVEDPELLAGNVFLENSGKRGVRKVVSQLLGGTYDGDPRSALSGIRLQDNRKLEHVLVKELFRLCDAALRFSSG